MIPPILSETVDKKPALADGLNKNVEQSSDFLDRALLQLQAPENLYLEFLSNRRSEILSKLKPSRNPRALVEIGDIHVAMGNFQQAIQTYRDAIKKDSYLLDAYRKLIPLLMRANKINLIDNYYKKLLLLTKNYPEVRHEYAMFKLAFKKDSALIVDSIQKEIEGLILQYPSNLNYKNSLGIILMVYRKKINQARDIFRNILDAEPNNIDALNNLGICLQSEKDFIGADTFYKKALKLNTLFTPAYENIASNFVVQRKFDKALDILEKGISKGIKYNPLWDHNVGWLLFLNGKFSQAKKWYIDKSQQEPGNNLIFNNLGACYENLHDEDSALDNYIRSVELTVNIHRQDPRYDDIRAINGFHNLGRILFKRKDYGRLNEIAKHLLVIYPDDPLGLYYLGTSRIQLKKYSSAIEVLEKCLSIDQSLPPAYIDLSFVLTMLHDYNKAIEVLNEAISHGHKDEMIMNNLAFAYIKNGNIEMAEQIVKPLSSDVNANAAATRGLIEFYKDNFTKGNKLYKEAIEKLSSTNKNEAMQTWKYEQANFFLRKGEIERAKIYLREAKKISTDTFIYDDIVKLLSTINTA